MISDDIPLPHSSSNIKMSQREKDELAEQWYAMMIKEEVESQHELTPTMSGLTRSTSAVSSRDDEQEQRDPNNRTYQYRGSDGHRLLEKNTQSRGNTDYEYQYKRGVSKNNQTKNNSKTDFLDGIIQSLSELSKGDKNSESKSILQEKKNGWSIHDSQRRMQERRSQRQLQEQNANAGVSHQFQQPNDVGIKPRMRQTLDPYGSRSLSSEEHPVARVRRSASRQKMDRVLDESEESSSNYRSYSSGRSKSGGSYSSGRSKSRGYSSGTSRSRGYSSGNSMSEGYSSGTSRSRQSAQSMPVGSDSSTYSFRKDRSWNIDKSLRSNKNSLFDVPTSPESNQTPELHEMILPLESASSLGSDKFPPQAEQVGNRRSASRESNQRSVSRESNQRSVSRESNQRSVSRESNQRSVSRENRTTSLASSSSKDAGKILQHFSIMPTSCGPINGTIDGDRALNGVVDFFDNPMRLRSNAVNKIREPPSQARRSYEPFPTESNGKIPKTQSQKELQREILRDMHKGTPKEMKDVNMSDDFEAIWGESEDREPQTERNLHSTETRFSIGGKVTDFGSISRNPVLRQLTSCNTPRHTSPPKTKNDTSSSSFGVFEKIQNQTKTDFSVFPMRKFDDNSRSSSSAQDQRIQEKLDAVRAKSLRNFQRIENGNNSETEDSAKKIQGKRLDKLFDINTDVLDDLAMKSDAQKTSAEKINTSSNGSEVQMTVSPAIIGQQGTHDTNLSHYMYVAYSQFGDDAQKVLKLCEHHTIPCPDRRKGEILIKIHASTISASDCAIRRGEWKNMSMDPYLIPGVALVGKAMGREKKKPRPSSSNVEPGDNVICLVRSGANARYICLQKQLLIKVPPKLKPERVVCLAETYLTAFQALHLGQRGGIRYRENSLKGQSILIMNAYSPVGKAIIELARIGGASICYGLVNDCTEDSEATGLGDFSSDILHRFKEVEGWGAIPLPADPQEWLTLIGRQIDILITSHDLNQGQTAGNGQITADHWKALKKEGQVHAVCAHPRLSELEQRNLIFGSQASNKGMDAKAFRIPSCRPGGKEKMADRAIFYNLFDSWEGDRVTRVMARNDLIHLVKLLESDLLHPEIVERVPLSKIAKAQRSLELNTVTGAGHFICSPWMKEKSKIRKAAAQPQVTKKYEL